MSVELNHTIVRAKDKRESAEFFSAILGLPKPEPFAHFLEIRTSNGVTLDFDVPVTGAEVMPQHYAFLVSESEFDEIFGRIKDRAIDYWADPRKERPGQINRRDGGRGLYFHDPSGHFLEVLTRAYGSGEKAA